jgi:hypothetical protein
MNRYELQKELLGDERFVYPGHPLVTACLVMMAFPSFESAAEKNENGQCPNALSDSRIPGSGGCVYNALDLLRHIPYDEDIEATIRRADETWGRVDGMATTTDEYRQKKYQEGLAQAKKVAPIFRGLVAIWKGASRER